MAGISSAAWQIGTRCCSSEPHLLAELLALYVSRKRNALSESSDGNNGVSRVQPGAFTPCRWRQSRYGRQGFSYQLRCLQIQDLPSICGPHLKTPSQMLELRASRREESSHLNRFHTSYPSRALSPDTVSQYSRKRRARASAAIERTYRSAYTGTDMSQTS